MQGSKKVKIEDTCSIELWNTIHSEISDFPAHQWIRLCLQQGYIKVTSIPRLSRTFAHLYSNTIMHPKWTVSLLAAVGSAVSASDVIDLKKDSFDAFINENNLVLCECEWLVLRACSRFNAGSYLTLAFSSLCAVVRPL